MNGRRIKGVPRRSSTQSDYNMESMPAPSKWVVTATYPNQVVWGLFSKSGGQFSTVSNYILQAEEHASPPYEECDRTAVLERSWDGTEIPWRDPPEYTVRIQGTPVLRLPDQPGDEEALTSWWDEVITALEQAATTDEVLAADDGIP